MGRRVVSAVVAVAVLLLVGCSADGPRATEEVQRAGGTTALVIGSKPVAVMEAQIYGTVVRTDSGCLAVEQDERTYVLRLPFGSSLTEDGRSVDVPGHGRLMIGDRVDGGGGYLQPGDAAPECQLDVEVAVWQT